MNKSDSQSEAGFSGKQLLILDAAERLFGARGFEGTSVRDIAQEAGVNLAMISYYFGSKEGLLEALFANRISAGRLVLEYLLKDTSMEPMAKIDHLVDGIVDRMIDHRAFYRIMLRAQLDDDNKMVSDMIADMKVKNLELVAKLIQEGQRKKVFVTNVDVSMMMISMVGTIYQAAAGSQYLRRQMKTEGLSDKEYADILRKKLKTHLKHLFKAALTYDGK